MAFASELRPLATLPDLNRRMDPEALGGYLCLNYVPGDNTLMEGVHRVAPGSWLKFSPHGEQGDRYWSPPAPATVDFDRAGNVPSKSAATLVDEWNAHFDRAVRLSLVSDVPVGILLSGGIDSSLVAESAMRQGGLSRAYVLDFDEDSFSEFDAANTVASRLGLPLERVPLTSAALRNFLTLVEHADDPLADSSAVAVWAVTQYASQHNKVVLGGDGGDELFFGYLTYLASRSHARIVARLPRFVRSRLARGAERIPVSERKVAGSYKLWRFLRAADLPTGLAHLSWNGTWLPAQTAELVQAFAQDEVARALPNVVARYDTSRSPTVRELRNIDLCEYLPNDILAKTDRISMAHGLEVRAPFLECEFATWALRLPTAVNLRFPQTLKAFLRDRARDKFGPAIADRKKQGFSIPIHAWLREPEMAELVRELLSPSSLARVGVLNEKRIGHILDLHFSGQRSYGFELWGLAVLVAWHRARIEQPPRPRNQEPLTQRHYEQLSHAR
jgi:asparagine synthase (glutamine-hydrolysing)